MRSSAARAFAFLFFLSGATGLVYELLWVRLLYQAFGSTIQSVTTVVAAYMGGLGLGAWLLGRRADRHPRPADRKSTRLNSSHLVISYAVFCLKKKTYLTTVTDV